MEWLNSLLKCLDSTLQKYSYFSTPNVPVKEHTDNTTTADSEFSPAYSFELNTNPTQCEVDTFDHILQVTSHHEAVYAYYYMDDDNKVKTWMFGKNFRIQTTSMCCSFEMNIYWRTIFIPISGEMHKNIRFNQ